MCSTCLAIVLIGSHIWHFAWYQNRWPWTTKWPLFCVILPYLVVSGAHCIKLVDKAITRDSLRLPCLILNVCRGIARRPWYKHSTTAWWKFFSRFVNSRLNAQYLPSYHLDRKSYMGFRLVSKSVTLNDLERWNGPYFALLYRIWEFPEHTA